MNILKSSRGVRLVYQGVMLPRHLRDAVAPHERTVLTCELWGKWYALYIVTPRGGVLQADLRDIEDFAESNETAVGDHCWNPAVLLRLAQARGWDIDDLSWDLIVGRWVNDHENRYGEFS